MTPFNPNDKVESFDRELIPIGVHAARCARVIEIGNQYSEMYDSESNKAVIVLSLSHLIKDYGELGEKQSFMSNGFGITISNSERGTMKQYTRALDPEGQASCLGDFLGKACQISVVHKTKNEKTTDKIDAISPLLPGTEIPPLDTEPFWFEWNNPNGDYWVMIPSFTQTLIKGARNYPGSYVEEMVTAIEGSPDVCNTDDLPM